MYRVLLVSMRVMRDVSWPLNLEVTRFFVASDLFFTVVFLDPASLSIKSWNWSEMNGFLLLLATVIKSGGILSKLRSIKCLASYYNVWYQACSGDGALNTNSWPST
jgi:hypothetical protein